MDVELRDVADGLWLWRQPHLDWSAGHHWEPEVSSFAVDAGGVGVLLDPLAPPPGSSAALWERLDALAPEAVVILKPDHVRDVDLFVRWYGLRALGPRLFLPGDVPRTALEPVLPGDELPGGLRALQQRQLGQQDGDVEVVPKAHRARVPRWCPSTREEQAWPGPPS